MSERKCYRCGKDPAEGFASISTAKDGERWYCHGDDDESPTCYEQGSRIGDVDAVPAGTAYLQAVRMCLDAVRRTSTHPKVLEIADQIEGELDDGGWDAAIAADMDARWNE